MEPKAPKDEKGRFISRDCGCCGYGTLQHEGNGVWRCDGLADPEHDDMPLIECPQLHIDGEPFVPATV